MTFYKSRATCGKLLMYSTIKLAKLKFIVAFLLNISYYPQPSKVAKLVVVDISPVPSIPSGDFFPKLLSVMKSVSFEGLDSAQKAKNAVKAKIEESGLVKNADHMYFIFMNIGQGTDGSFRWKYNIDALIKYFHEIASFPDLSGKTYEGPTLFVGGQESDYLP